MISPRWACSAQLAKRRHRFMEKLMSGRKWNGASGDEAPLAVSQLPLAVVIAEGISGTLLTPVNLEALEQDLLVDDRYVIVSTNY